MILVLALQAEQRAAIVYVIQLLGRWLSHVVDLLSIALSLC